MKNEASGVLIRVLCCLPLLFSINQTSAATFMVNDTSDRVDTSPGNGVCRTSAGTCTLRAAIQEANARFGADLIRLPRGTFRLTRAPLNQNDIATGDLDITGPVTILGDGADFTFLDGGTPPPGSSPDRTALDRLFEIHPTAGNVTISRLTIRKGWDQKEGGALRNASPGVVQLIQVNVLNSVAINGGAIFHDGFAGGRLVITRSTIVGNQAGGDGGAIYMPSGSLSVSGTADFNSLIAANTARSGGGIYSGGMLTQSGLRSRVELAYTIVTGNTADNAGGGINNELMGDLVLSDVLVSDNDAGDSGGGVSSDLKTSLSVMRGTFSGNFAYGAGGGVFSHSEEAVIIEDSEFTGNAGGGGGGGGLSVDGRGTVTVTGSMFSGNSTTNEGGGIAIHSFGTVEISDSTVQDNTADYNGGGVLNSGFVVNFSRLIISGNMALNNGGGIDNQSSSDFTLLNSQFISNSAGRDGGGLHNTPDGPLWMSDCRFHSNTAGRDGGGFHNTSDGPLQISDSSFHSNTAHNGGGLNNVADKPLSITGSTFWDNRAANTGGGLLHRSDGPTDVVNTTISGNVAGFNGGGLYLDGDAGLHVINTTITRNSAPHGSGVGTADAIDNFPIVSHPFLLFRNTIVAGNFGGSDCHAAFGSEGGNLDGGTLCNFNGPRDRANVVNLGLEDIADNGGPTLTHALTLASPAVGGGVGPCLPTDQRGVAREENLPCDIGAYEFIGTPEVPPDITYPETVLNSGPSDTIESSEAIFAFSSNEPGSTFICSLDRAPFTPCVSPLRYLDLSEGVHTFEVHAIDPAGNVDPTPASFTWTIEVTPDTTPPETFINSGPAATTESTEAEFKFSASEPGTTFTCSLDGGPFVTCASPITYVSLAAGIHSFAVSASDALGNADPTPATHSWTVEPPPDTTPPETVITGHPTFTTESKDAAFVFSASEPGATFQCALDGPSFNNCDSPHEFSGLSLGTHTFYVRATDTSGNLNPTPTSFTWTIVLPPDTTPPETFLASGPATPTDLTYARFTFSASESGASFECALDVAAFTPCPVFIEYTDLEEGDHSFAVRAIDVAGNVDPSPVTYTWTIEFLDTIILSGPPASSESTSATFIFEATTASATFECKLDAGAFAPCVSPALYTGLAAGEEHIFEVRAKNSAGQVDPSPATYGWMIEPPSAACGPPLTLLADADAWIDENSSSANKGADTIIKVQSKGPRDNFRALLRFPLPTAPAGCVLQTAILLLHAPSAKEDRTLEAIALDGAWSEFAVTWENQPATIGPAAATPSGTGYRVWNVTSQVQAMLQAGVNNGFLIRDANETESGFEQQFHSREKGENPPLLIITFAPAP